MQSLASGFGYFDQIDYFICGHFTKNLGQNPRKNQAVELALTTHKILFFFGKLCNLLQCKVSEIS